MKKNLRKILKFLAEKVLNKYHPEVAGVTGSVGKTLTKEAIYTVLKNQFKIRKSAGNYNNEIGVPLTVLECDAAGKSVFGWLKIILKGLRLILLKDKNYPQVLVLEMAADHPGDIKYLTSMIPCKIGAVTTVGPTHLEFFKTIENVAKEKSLIVSHLKDTGWAILNYDDELVRLMGEKTKAKILTFGFSEEADVRASEMNIDKDLTAKDLADEIKGINFKIHYEGNIVPMFLPKVLGKQQIYAALAGAAAGLAMGMNLVEISEALKKYKSPPGRMGLIAGVKHTLIIDDSYNASPLSVKAALETIKEIPAAGKRIAILGDMLELGEFTKEAHRQVGEKAAESGVDILVTVGERAKHTGRAAIKRGMAEDNVFGFSNTEEAGRFIQDKIRRGDLILIKGSQGMRMEKITKELMAEPLRAKELLVRQSENWLKR